MKTFSERLKQVMGDLNLTQKQVAELTGTSRASVSEYLSGRYVPADEKKQEIAEGLGLDPEYFLRRYPEEPATPISRRKANDGAIRRLSVEEAARRLGMAPKTVRDGLVQKVFPWGYAIRTSEKRYAFFINAARFEAIEGITV